MTNGNPPRPPARPRFDQVRPIEERYAPPPGQRPQMGPAQGHPGAPPQRHGQHVPGGAPAGYGRGHGGGSGGGSGGRHGDGPRKRSGLGSFLLVAVLGLGILIAAGVTFILLAPPTDLIREQAIAAVKDRTGRDLVIGGPARLTFYPSIGVSLADVSLSSPLAMGGAPTVSMERLDVSVKLLPLISRSVEVSRLVLTRPKFSLRVDKAGRKSWDMAWHAGSRLPLRFAQARTGGSLIDSYSDAARTIAQRDTTGAPSPTSSGAPAGLNDLVLDDVRIVDGAVEYTDDRSGVRHSATSIDMRLKSRTMASPMSLDGDLDWQGQTVTVDGTLTSVAEIVANKPAKLSLKISAKPMQAGHEGAIDLSNGASLDGNVDAKSPSLRALALWLGQQLPPNDGFGAFSMAGRLKTEPNAFHLQNADISLDAMRIKGQISGLTGRGRPAVRANLKVSELNLNTYMGSGTAPARSLTQQRKTAPDVKGKSNGAGNAARPQSIEDLLDRSGPRVKGYTARAGWSDDPIDLSILGLVDADARLSVAKLIVREITVGPSDLIVDLKDRVAKTTFERVQLYQGQGRGFITVDASTATPTIGANLIVDNVAAAPLLKDAASIDWLSGTGKLTVATTSQGRSQSQLVSTLNGKASFSFADGAIKGFNVAKAIRGLNQGRLTNLSATPEEKTDFSELSASFDIVNGVASNTDLTLLSPLLRVTGDGQVMLPPRTVDYTVRPKLVANLSGQTGATGLGGLEVPVKITGNWDKPKIAPDLSKIDAKQAIDAVQELGKKFKGKNANEIVDDLFGKDSKDGQKAKKLLDNLFR